MRISYRDNRQYTWFAVCEKDGEPEAVFGNDMVAEEARIFGAQPCAGDKIEGNEVVFTDRLVPDSEHIIFRDYQGDWCVETITGIGTVIPDTGFTWDDNQVKKLRRRIEDRLRKEANPSTIFWLAEFLGVKTGD